VLVGLLDETPGSDTAVLVLPRKPRKPQNRSGPAFCGFRGFCGSIGSTFPVLARISVRLL
jgi:hypothetical protein